MSNPETDNRPKYFELKKAFDPPDENPVPTNDPDVNEVIKKDLNEGK